MRINWMKQKITVSVIRIAKRLNLSNKTFMISTYNMKKLNENEMNDEKCSLSVRV